MSRADRFTDADVKSQYYSDFLTDLNRHPVSGDITRYVNEKAVIRSIRNLFSTDKFERFCQPTICSNIKRLLFEPMGSIVEDELRKEAIDVIDKHEPRAKVLKLDIKSDYDRGAYYLFLSLMILGKQDPVSFTVTLARVR